jgi:WD40 repeat protein/tetratricopeptide (TPR) repeat protein/serine/threonine protein kinase
LTTQSQVGEGPRPQEGPSGRETERREPPPETQADSRRTRSFARQKAEPESGPEGPATKFPAVAGYEILGKLGRGGMGVVYQARQVSLKRLVALKMIRGGADADAEDLTRFRTEAEAVAKVRHPHIVQIYEVGEYQGLPFFSLEYCEGGSLAERLKTHPMGPRQAARFVETLARAMHATHERKIIHRDLKPANVLLTAEGEPKITDFGLAKKLDEVVGQTHTGAVMGTPSYMAPEQAAGKTKEIGPAADIYALGAILYELLTGRPPFQAKTTLETVVKVLSEDPVPPQKLKVKLPTDLETICLKCLRKEPQKRYGTAQALAEDLRRFLDDQPIVARPAGKGERLWRWCRRNPVIAGLTAMAGCLLIAVGVVTAISIAKTEEGAAKEKMAQEAKREARRAKSELTQFQENRTKKQKSEEKKTRDLREHRLYLADMRRAFEAWEKEDLLQVRRLLRRHRPRPGHRDNRCWEWFLLQALSREALYSFPGHDKAITALAWSPDGGRLASASEDATVKVWSMAGKEPGLLFRGKHKARIGAACWSPRGGQLATASADGTLKVWDANSGTSVFSAHTDLQFPNSAPDLAWSRDGKRIVWQPGGGIVHVYETIQGKVPFSLKWQGKNIGKVCFSPDGSKLALEGLAAAPPAPIKPADQSIKIIAIDTGKTLHRFEGSPLPLDTLSWSSDGRWLAAARGGSQMTGIPGEVTIWNAATGKEFVRWNPPIEQDRFGFRSGSVQLAWAGKDKQFRLFAHPFSASGRPVWDKGPVAAGKGPMVARTQPGFTTRLEVTKFGGSFNAVDRRFHGDHRAEITTLVWSADGRRLASASVDATIKVWEAGEGIELFSAKEKEDSGKGRQFIAWGPDGNRTVWQPGESKIRVYEVKTGKAITTLEGYKGKVRSAAVSPDGSWVALRSRDNSLGVWSISTGKRKSVVSSPLDSLSSLAFSPDGRQLAIAGRGKVEVVDWDKDKPIVTLRTEWNTEDKECRLEWEANGKTIRLLQGFHATVWQTRNWQKVLSLSLVDGARSSLSPDGRRAANIVANDGSGEKIRIWDASTGRPVLDLRSFRKGQATVVSWRPARPQLAAGNSEGKIKLWEAKPDTKPEPRFLPTKFGEHPDFSAMAWGPDGRTLALLRRDMRDRKIIHWNPGTGSLTTGLTNNSAKSLRLVSWKPDGRKLAAGFSDGSVRLWDFAGPAVPKALAGHAAEITGLVWSKDGRRLLSASADGRVCVWDAFTGKRTAAIKPNSNVQGIPFSGPVLFWSPDGRWLARGDKPFGAREIIDLDSGSGTPLPTTAEFLAWSPDSRHCSFGGTQGLKIWDVRKRLEVHNWSGINVWLNPLAWSPDGKKLAAGIWPSNEIQIVDAANGNKGVTLGKGPLNRGKIEALAWSPDGEHLASIHGGQQSIQLNIWTTASGKHLRTLRAQGTGVPTLYWGPDGKTLALVSDGFQSRAGQPPKDPSAGFTVWEVGTGKEVLGGSVNFHPDSDSWVAMQGKKSITLVSPVPGSWLLNNLNPPVFSRDGRQLAGSARDLSRNTWTIKVCNGMTGRETFARGDAITGEALAWGPDGIHLAAADTQGKVEIWNTYTSQRSCLIQAGQPGFEHPMAWSSDGYQIALEGPDSAVEVWEAFTGKKLHSLWGHEGGIRSITWSPAGRWLASSSRDGTIRIWDLRTEKARATLTAGGQVGFNDGFIAWSPDSRRFASANGGKIKIWDTTRWKEALILPGSGPLIWSPDGRCLLAKEQFGKVVVWKAAPFDNDPNVRRAVPPQRRYISIRFSTIKNEKGRADIQVEAQLEEPLPQIRDAAVYYLPAKQPEEKLKPNKQGRFPRLPGGVRVRLEIAHDRARGSFQFLFKDKALVRLLFQTACRTGQGQTEYSPPNVYLLDAKVELPAAKKDYTPWSLPAVPERKPVVPPKLVGDFPLGAKYRDVAVGGGGRYLVFCQDDAKKLAVFDVSQARTVGTIPLPDGSPGEYCLAAGMDKVVVVQRKTGMVERWSLPEGKREATARLPWTKVTAIALGSASRGPLFVGWQKDRFLFVDLDSLSPLASPPVRVASRFGRDEIDLGNAPRVRASANGRTFSFWCSDGGPNGINTIIVSDHRCRAYYEHQSAWHVVPGPSGEPIYTSDGMLSKELVRNPAWHRIQEWVLPAVHGDYYLRVLLTGQFQGPLPVRPTVHRLGQAGAWTSIPQLGTFPTRGSFVKPGQDVALDKRFYLIPEAGVLAVLTPTNDRVVLHRVNLGSSQKAKDDAPAYLHLGTTLHAKGQFQEAADCFREALRIRKDSAEAHFRLGCSLEQLKQSDAALASFREAIRLNKDYHEAHGGLGLLLSARGRHDEAVAACKEAVRIKNDYAEGHNSLGHVLQNAGRLDQAIASFREAVRLKKDYAEGNYNLGSALEKKGRLDEAIASFREAARLNKDHVAARNNLAVLLAVKGQLKPALVVHKETLPANTKVDDGAAYTSLGSLLQQRGYLDQAIAAFKEAVRLKKEDPQAGNMLANALQAKGAAHAGKGELKQALAAYKEAATVLKKDEAWVQTTLGNALWSAGRLDQALAAFKEAVRLNKEDPQAHLGLGNILWAKGQLDQAIPAFKEAIRLKKDDPWSHTVLGNALLAKGQTDQAIASYREAIRLKKDFPGPYLGLGNALRAKGRLDEAIIAFRNATRLKQDYAEAHDLLGQALRDKGRLDDAIRCFQTVTWLKRNDAQAHMTLGHALQARGQLDQAIAAFKEAVRLKKDNAQAHIALGHALQASGQLDQAIAAFKEAVRLKKDDPGTHVPLAFALQQTGQFAQALAAFKRAHRLVSKNPRLRQPTAEWVRNCERFVELDAKLPAIRSGKAKSRDAAEALEYAQCCQYKRLTVTAARLYEEAFTAKKELAQALQSHRYNAACNASLAGSGQGKDAKKLDVKERARWRRQALAWLRLELEGWTKKQAAKDTPQVRAEVQAVLQHWKRDPDLAGLREWAALNKLSRKEAKACRKLWADVEAHLARTKPK